MKTPLALVLILTALLLSACSGPSSTRSKNPDDAKSTDEPAAGTQSGRKVGEWEILRSELRRHVKRGAGYLLSKVRVRAAFHKSRFFGWRVLSYRGPGKKVQIGDIVTRINGKPIERDYQFIAVWNDLAKHDTLVVKLVRGGKPMVLRYKIGD